MMVVPLCLSNRRCSSGYCSVVAFFSCCSWVLYLINRDDGDESPPLLAFQRHVVNAIFLKYSKGGRLSSSRVVIRNIPSDVCYDDAKHYQVQSEHRRAQNPFKYLR